jgi:alpha-galactosidase
MTASTASAPQAEHPARHLPKPEIKIAYIGGGSRYWARDLMKDLALTSHLTGVIELYDINHQAAERNVGFAKAIFSSEKAISQFEVRANPDLDDTLRGADFVVLSIEPGPVEMRFAELEIPQKYGVFQPVGDTVGPGGLIRALRAIPAYLEFAHAIMQNSPRAWVINYTNPMSLCTRALHAAEPGIQAFGCCHEVFGSQNRLAKMVTRRMETPDISRRDIKVDVNGVNHFTWITQALWEGQDVLPMLREEVSEPGIYEDKSPASRARKAQGKWFGDEGLVTADLTRRFGAMAAAGDRHLVEFVPWYALSEENLHRWGVVLTPYSFRYKRSTEADVSLDSYDQNAINPSGEEGVKQMEALLGLRDLDTNVNLPNTGQSAQFPPRAVVETNAQFRRNSLKPVHAKPLPTPVAGLVRRVIDMQELTLTAAMERSAPIAFQALLMDPLARLSTDTAAEMFRDMLDHTRPMLDGWDLKI